MAKSQLRLVTPTTVNRTVTPRRARNSELRSREYLTAQEVEALMDAAAPAGVLAFIVAQFVGMFVAAAVASWPSQP